MPSQTVAITELPPTARIDTRLDALPWSRLETELDTHGFARVAGFLAAEECRSIAGLFDDGSRFRARVVMGRHGFGRGEYRYFDHPLPALVSGLRAAAYSRLAPIANTWAARSGLDRRFPRTLAAFHVECAAAGQTKPTPLLLKYGPDDYNRLHQDLYGDLVFPLQMAVLLSQPGDDFTGGEFVLTEQRPRMQSKVEVVPLARGDAVIFAVNHRPVLGASGRGHRVALRHGVSRIRSGQRFTLGLIFHDAP